jgi:tRNA dimethylallyltransferase
MDIKNKPLIIIAGPTACGKTAVSVELAQRINAEIISADSMQVYKGMDIGTAKVRPEETKGIKHYLIDEFEPDEDFSVAVFKQRAVNYIDEIYGKDKLPIIAGGTGFYINSVIYDNNFDDEETDTSIRDELNEFLEKNGKEALYELLKEVDKKSCEKIHINNTKRVIRAIEFYRQSGKKISEHNEEEKKKQPAYNYRLYVLNMNRERLYERINKRIDIMLDDGLVEEVKSLLEKYSSDLVSMQGLGYKEFVPYLNGECSLDEAVENLKKSTRHFAKRQLTWFKHQCEDAVWIDMDAMNAEEAAQFMAEDIRKHLEETKN